MGTDRQFCTFFVDGMYCGVEVLRVQEVIRYQDMTRVPLAPAVVHGLINLRGQIVTAIDLRERLGLKPRPEGVLPMNVVVRTADGATSLLVDEIGDVVTVREEDFERPPETISGVTRELIEGVFKLKDRLLIIVDTERAIGVAAAA